MGSEEQSPATSADAVEEQLARILASRDFANAGSLSAFLQFVVRETLAGNSEGIKEYAVGTGVFNRPESFDPRLDTIVRVQASKLRSRLAEYYATNGANDAIVIELPRGSYVPVFRTKQTTTRDIGTIPPATPKRNLRRRRGLIAAALAVGSIGILAALYGIRASQKPFRAEPIRFTLSPPENTSFYGFPGVSPDGRHVINSVMTALGKNGLWLRSLDAVSGQILPGTERATATAWSEDGKYVLFRGPGISLTRMDVAGVQVPRVIPGPILGFGISWGRDDVILFTPTEGSGIGRIAATGGSVSLVTSLDDTDGELAHYWPQFLPDGRRFIYFTRNRNPAKNAIYVGSLDGKLRKRLLTSESRAQYAAVGQESKSRSGYLLYVREGTLFAQKFDPGKLELSGEAKPLLQDVLQLPYGMASFSASSTGALVYSSRVATGAQFTWLDRSGKKVGTVGPTGLCGSPIISPDGRRIAFDLHNGPNRDIWTADIATGHAQRLTFDREVDHAPVWSPDGSRITFDSHRSGLGDLYLKTLSGASSENILLRWKESATSSDWSRDDALLAFTSWSRADKADIWILPLQPGGKPFPYLQTKSNESGARFSPDTRWIAYVSDESGRAEIYVQPFDGASPASGGKFLISNGGGSQPVWRGDGKELFYLSPDNKLMAVEVNTKGTFTSREPKPLFVIDGLAHWGPRNDYDVSPDGRRFLVSIVWRPTPPAPVNVFLNWPAQLER